MKKILYFLLSIILILQTPFFVSANVDEVHVNSADFNMLKTLGVFDGIDISESDESVTRAQLAASVYNLFKYTGYKFKNEGQFIDVGTNHFAFNAVNALYELGFVSGVSSEFFAPEGKVTVNEAIKIIVSALGYSDYAKVKGGYPTGYILTARKLDILSVNYASENVSAFFLAELLANALRACPLTEESISGNEIIYGSNSGDSLGKLNFDLYEAEGFASGIEPADVFEISNGENDIITINKTQYYVDNVDAFSFVGKYVEFWYTKTDKEKIGTVIAVSESSSAKTLTINSEDISSFANNEYVLYVENKKEVAKIDSTSEIFYNGRNIPYFSEVMIPSNGTVTFVDYKGNNAYDSVIISNYINAYVGGVDSNNNTIWFEEKVSFPKISGVSLKIEDISSVNASKSGYYLKIYNKNLDESDISSMSRGQIASIYFDPYGNGAIIYYTSSSVTGVIDSVYSTGDKVTIKNTNYKVIYDKISRNDIYSGANGKYLLDYLGNIVYIDTKDSDLKSAFFLKAIYTEGLGGKPYIQLVDFEQKKTLELELKSTIKFGDATYGNNKLKIDSVATVNSLSSKLKTEFSSGTANKYISNGFIRYKTNSLGQVIEIHTTTSPDCPIEKHLNALDDKLNGLQTNTTLNTIGDKVLYNDGITVFVDAPYVTDISNVSYLDNASSVLTFMSDSMLGSNATLDKFYDIYYFDDSDMASVIIKYGKELTQPVESTGDPLMPKGTFDNLAMFAGKSNGIDENGESCEIIRFIDVNGVENKYFVSSKYTSNSNIDYSLLQENLKPGDVFTYYIQDNVAGNFLKIYDNSIEDPMSAFKGAPNYYTVMKTGDSKYQSITASTATSGRYNTTYRASVGRVYEVKGNVLSVALGNTKDDSNLAYFNVNSDSIVVYDSENRSDDKVRKGTLADLKGIAYYGEDDASKVVVYIKNGRDITLFVYN